MDTAAANRNIMKISTWCILLVSAVCSALPMFSSDSLSETLSQGSVSSGATIGNAVLQACKIDPAKFPRAQTDTDDLVRLMHKYLSVCHGDLSAIDSTFESEARDGQWAVAVERKITEIVARLDGLTMTGECRRSLCRIDFESASPALVYTNTLDLHARTSRLLKGTSYDVGWINVPTPTGIREYLYSKNLPAAFVEPFLQKMRE